MPCLIVFLGWGGGLASRDRAQGIGGDHWRHAFALPCTVLVVRAQQDWRFLLFWEVLTTGCMSRSLPTARAARDMQGNGSLVLGRIAGPVSRQQRRGGWLSSAS